MKLSEGELRWQKVTLPETTGAATANHEESTIIADTPLQASQTDHEKQKRGLAWKKINEQTYD